MNKLEQGWLDALKAHINVIYDNVDDRQRAVQLTMAVIDKYDSRGKAASHELWTERDVVLIAYGQQISGAESCLAEFTNFYKRQDLGSLFSHVHLLPFYPYTSDDGFSVSDYFAVDPEIGSWEDIQTLRQHTRLMFDYVVNHTSQAHQWFKKFCADEPDYADFYATADPSADLSDVVRPRASPLLTDYAGKHVWTTFSADQVDLNFRNPATLAAMIDVLMFYLHQGAEILRLDAIAFLWKELGTTCLHQPQTHAVVKLMREICDRVAPGCLVLTETNVPHAENISYFGEGDEAHMVYQFSLPPLLCEAILAQDATHLNQWLTTVCDTMPQTTYFNFTASHDGIGVRPLQGLLPSNRIEKFCQKILAANGAISYRSQADGSQSPYELNCTYLSALVGDSPLGSDLHLNKFLTSQFVMLSLKGVPAVYFQSLVGGLNDLTGVEQSGIKRRINRQFYQRERLEAELQSDDLHGQVFRSMQALLKWRRRQPALHPDADQVILQPDQSDLILILRQCPEQQLLCVANVTGRAQPVAVEGFDPREISPYGYLSLERKS